MIPYKDMKIDITIKEAEKIIKSKDKNHPLWELLLLKEYRKVPKKNKLRFRLNE